MTIGIGASSIFLAFIPINVFMLKIYIMAGSVDSTNNISNEDNKANKYYYKKYQKQYKKRPEYNVRHTHNY